MNHLHSFASDNWAGAHPAILGALNQCNEGHLPAYGDDVFTSRAKQLIQKLFEADEAEVIFTYNGTAANVLSVASCCKSYEAIICAETAHINTDECGAIEKFTGSKIYALSTPDGKITPVQIEPLLGLRGNVHHNQPRVISISQPTEMGTVYTTKEIEELALWAHQHGLLLHMDGARIANATVYLAEPIANFTTHAGVDIVTFGGTKNGMLFGDSIVVLNKSLSDPIKYLQKQGMQLLSKMRYIGAQYIAYLTDDLWLKNAYHANQMARLLEKSMLEIPQVNIVQKVQANSIFARLPEKIIAPLQAFSYFYRWEENESTNQKLPLVRLMCSFNTQKEDVLNFAGSLKKLLHDEEK